MKKVVTYEGIKYNITLQEYGYSASRLVVNNSPSSRWIANENLLQLDIFKNEVEKAIKEYVNRMKLHNDFNKWDGKI